MTPEERVVSICEGVERYLHKMGHYNIGFEIQFREVITAEIQAAVEEAETKTRMMHTLMVEAFDQRDKATAEAYEDAAKIADLAPGTNGRQIAKEIRARAKELK